MAEDEQWFNEWAENVGLNRKTTAALRRVDCMSKKALLLVTEQDIGKISEISLGQAKLMAAAIRDMRDTATTSQEGPAPESPNDTEDNG